MDTWAVVTGASSGLGAGYARHLAAQGVGVVLAARSGDQLAQFAKELKARHGVPTKVFPVDLTNRADRTAFIAEVANLPVSYLVNNAGFATMSEFVDIDPGRMGQEIELNVVALTELTRAVAPGMMRRGRGAIINVASTAAFQPIPRMAVYAATKAYVLQFTVALWEELKPTGVRAIAICPGPTETKFFAVAGDESVMSARRSVEQVVATTFKGLARHQPLIIDGTQNRVLALANRFVPHSLQAIVARRVVSH